MDRLHPQILALLETGASSPLDAGPSRLQALREGYRRTAEELGGVPEPVAQVADHAIARPDGTQLALRLHVPAARAAPAGVLVWLHGGGWIMGDLDGIDRVCRALANASGQAVVSPDYRLAPEHPYPAAADDAELAVRWAAGEGARRLGADPARVAVGGDSAGGNLAAVVALRAAQVVRAQLLVYPALDASMSSAAYAQFAEGPMLRGDEMAACWRLYGAEADIADPGLSPSAATDLAGLPGAWIAVAGVDPLRDDGVEYARRLCEAGVPVELVTFDDMTHGFLRWGGVVDRQRELVGFLAGALRAAFA